MKIEKYHKVTREDYESWYRENRPLRKQVQEDKNRLRFHLMPRTGWLNDPNGLYSAGGLFHIYFQYTPFEPLGEVKLWNHCTTRDFIHYEDYGPALFPDQDFDAHGAYSGSAFREKGLTHYFYTGNLKYFDRSDYDYINTGRGSNTIHFTSSDGFHFSEKELLMTADDYPEDMSCHVRDPKILKHQGAYYMALGARDRDSRGLVLLYRSPDLKHWEYFSRIVSSHPLGYMWECPDLFFLDQELCLICCPQGVEHIGLNYENYHQCVFMRIEADFENRIFTVKEEGLLPSVKHPGAQLPLVQTVDRGFDFYAPQSFEDETGRRILIGWMGIPEAEYGNRPTVEKGWQHTLTLPRLLSVREGQLYQSPLPELEALRVSERHYPSPEKLRQIPLPEKEPVYEAVLTFSSCHHMELALRDGLWLKYADQELALVFTEGGEGRTVRKTALPTLSKLQIFSDTSCVEIFVNDGAQVFTSRAYSGIQNPCLKLQGSCEADLTLYQLSSFTVSPRSGQKGLCAIGEALIDFIPDTKGLRLKDVAGFTRAAGGAPCNVAAAVSRLGLPARMVTKVGDDAFGDYLLDTMADAGIDISQILKEPEGETALAFVSLAADGNRDFKFYRKNSADLLCRPEDIREDVLEGCGAIHFCSIDLVDSPMKEAHRKLIRMAADKGLLISFDPNLRPSLWNDDKALKAAVKEFLPLAHIVKISDEELTFITGESSIEKAVPKLLTGRTECVIYTKGGDGAEIFTSSCHVARPGWPIQVKDTTGAGDSFIGAILCQLLKAETADLSSLSPETLAAFLDYANAFAAHTAAGEGAIPSMADEDGLAEWMAEHRPQP